MKKNGCKFTKLKITEFMENYRGVVATKNIKKGDIILQVPYSQMITFENVRTTEVAEKMLELGMEEDKYGSTMFYCVYILQQLKQPAKKREFGPLLDLLPKNYNEFPFLYT